MNRRHGRMPYSSINGRPHWPPRPVGTEFGPSYDRWQSRRGPAVEGGRNPCVCDYCRRWARCRRMHVAYARRWPR